MAIKEKKNVENNWDCYWAGNGGSIKRKKLRDISKNVLIVKADFIIFNVFVMLFQMNLK